MIVEDLYLREDMSLRKHIFTVLYWIVPNLLLIGFAMASGRPVSTLYTIFMYAVTILAVFALFKFKLCNDAALFGGLFISPLLLLLSDFSGIYFIVLLFIYVIPFLALVGILSAIIFFMDLRKKRS